MHLSKSLGEDILLNEDHLITRASFLVTFLNQVDGTSSERLRNEIKDIQCAGKSHITRLKMMDSKLTEWEKLILENNGVKTNYFITFGFLALFIQMLIKRNLTEINFNGNVIDILNEGFCPGSIEQVMEFIMTHLKHIKAKYKL